MIRIKSSRKGKEVMGNLLASIEKIVNNEDLLTDILLRVPTKSLVRFMCVSKHWRSLISDPKFCSNHTLRNPSPLVSRIYFCFSHWSCTEQIKFVSPHCSTTSFPKFDSLDSFPSIRMLCACNTLMLGQCSRSPSTHIVYNITTRKYRVLPESGGTSFPYTFPACLAFDPSKSTHYKVVLVRYYHGTSYEIDIYHSATGSWKRILIKEAPSTGKPSAPIAFWNGAVHWLNEKNSHLKFEVDAERLTSFPLPSNHGIPGKISLKYIGECGGHLYLIITSLHLPMGFKILEMETGRHSWAVKYEVKLRCSISVGPISKYSVLGVVKTSDNEFEVLLAIHGKVVCYNCKSTKMEILPVFPPGKFESACNYAFAYPFIESLAPV